MPISRERQRYLARKHPHPIVHAPTMPECTANAAWWVEMCSVASEPYQFHFTRHAGMWTATPYVDTTTTEQAIARSIERYHSLYGHDA